MTDLTGLLPAILAVFAGYSAIQCGAIYWWRYRDLATSVRKEKILTFCWGLGVIALSLLSFLLCFGGVLLLFEIPLSTHVMIVLVGGFFLMPFAIFLLSKPQGEKWAQIAKRLDGEMRRKEEEIDQLQGEINYLNSELEKKSHELKELKTDHERVLEGFKKLNESEKIRDELAKLVRDYSETMKNYSIMLEGYKTMLQFYRSDKAKHEESIRQQTQVVQGYQSGAERHGEGIPEDGGPEGRRTADYADLPETVRKVIPKALEMLKTEGAGPWLEMIPEEIASGRYRPVYHRILLAIREIDSKGGTPTISNISSITGINRKELKVFLQDMGHEGFVRTKVEGKSVIYLLPEKSFLKEMFWPVLRSQREGGEIASQLLLKARDHYLSEGWLFIPLKQIPGASMPDAIAIPPLGKRAREGWDFTNAVAVEVETPDEIRAHPDQVLLNIVKNFARGLRNVEIRCTEDSMDKVTDLYAGRIPDELKWRVTVSGAHWASGQKSSKQASERPPK
jgi:hypothetical protein